VAGRTGQNVNKKLND